MRDNEQFEQDEIFSKALRAGRRTYFFDVRPTKAGDYYLTITESKKFTQESGNAEYKKHKIFLYKEDFAGFKETLDEITDFIVNEKGAEVISERHQSNYTSRYEDEAVANTPEDGFASSRFTNVDFDDI